MLKAVMTVHALVQREASGNWVMSWPDGYAYDFWTDRDAAVHAAELATGYLQVHGCDADRIDAELRESGALGRARIRRRMDSGVTLRSLRAG